MTIDNALIAFGIVSFISAVYCLGMACYLWGYRAGLKETMFLLKKSIVTIEGTMVILPKSETGTIPPQSEKDTGP